MIRTFVAAELDSTLTHAIAGVQEKLKQELHRLGPRVRLQWVRPDSIHLTLKFLGAIEQSQVGIIVQALANAAREYVPFSVDVKGFGVFPDIRSPRVLWMGLSGPTDRLIHLAGSIDAWAVWEPYVSFATLKDQARVVADGEGLTADVQPDNGDRPAGVEDDRGGLGVGGDVELGGGGEVAPGVGAAEDGELGQLT